LRAEYRLRSELFSSAERSLALADCEDCRRLGLRKTASQQGVLNVRKSHLVAVAASLAVVTALVSTVVAQQPAGQAAYARPAQGIALLDLSRVLKEHPRFQQEMAALKGQVQTAETTMKQKRDELRSQAEVLKSYQPGSLDYKRLEEKITTDSAQLQADVQLSRKDFLEKEAKAYHAAYQEVQQIVNWLAGQYGYVAVLRYNGEQVDPNDPESILRDINKPVIWHNQGVDITELVLQQLNARAGTAARPAQPGIPQPPQRGPASGGIPIQR
jgi:Skp family chaperone for outer membrane proteins